ncbi:MAG: N-acetylmuramoyl-L-alanine amidase, partial [Candidatus Cloacimonetes bacterium]|nr:N-acetylmuramoyl-L-alanine amidase [Candidatus Cloacimonadota bacterium]
MRRGFLIIILLFLLVNLYTSVKVEYNSQLSSEIINTEYINGIEYFNVFELNKALKAQIKEDIIDQRLKVNIYGEQIIFLLESSYFSFGTDIYNTKFTLISKGDKHFLPVIFLKEILPLLYPTKIEFSNNKIIADTPVDKSIRTIVLDPGHGGKDPGAIGYSKNNYEK